MATRKDIVNVEVKDINLKVEKKRLYDYYTLDCARKFDEEQNPLDLFAMGERILGKDQFDKVVEKLTDKDGFLPLDKIVEVILEIPAAVREKDPN